MRFVDRKRIVRYGGQQFLGPTDPVQPDQPVLVPAFRENPVGRWARSIMFDCDGNGDGSYDCPTAAALPAEANTT